MIECTVYADRGLVRVDALSPNGVVTVTRIAQGVPDTVLRNGDQLTVSTGGWSLEDSEAPVGVPVTYRADLALDDRVIQQNLVLTPNFTHGTFAWAAGSGRTMSTPADPDALHTTAVGKFSSNAAGYSLTAPPALTGHIDTAGLVNGSYTLTPPTAGGTAIATGDWVYLIHQQNNTVAAPAAPTGFTTVLDVTGVSTRLMIWRRKRVAGDTGYTVVATGASSLGTCLWIRGAGDTAPTVGAVSRMVTGTAALAQVQPVTCLNPSLVLKVSAAQLLTSVSRVASSNVTGVSSAYAVGADPGARSLLAGTESLTHAQDSTLTTVSYQDQLSDLLAVQIAVPNATALTNRIVAKAKAAALAGPVEEPYRLSGRIKFRSTLVWLWDDVLANGTWDKLLADKATWADVLSSQVVAGSQNSRMYVVIVNPATGTFYTDPIQILGISDDQTNTWLNFIVYLPVATTIPSTAEIWFVHGTSAREYSSDWFLDSLGITPGYQVSAHDVLLHMDGDTPTPATGVDALLPSGGWTTTGLSGDDSVIHWTGTPGNSPSEWLAPTQIRGTATCQIDWPATETIPCEPVLLSDPVSSALGMWVGLLNIDTLGYSARGSDSDVIGRADPVATASVRAWARGTLTVMTTSLGTREQFLSLTASGRVLLLRNPDPDYPEDNWYLAVGSINESRISPDHRDGQRSWELPFTRVARPTGLIEASSGTTWDQITTSGWTWDELLAARPSWLSVLTEGVDA